MTSINTGIVQPVLPPFQLSMNLRDNKKPQTETESNHDKDGFERAMITTKDNRVLAFDQALSATGWAFFIGTQLVDYGIISPYPKSLKDGARLHNMRNQMSDLIDKCSPGVILNETPVGSGNSPKGMHNNWGTLNKLSQLQGVVLELCAAKKVINEQISPSSWQYTCGIHKRERAARKAGARDFVKKVYKIDDVQQDAIDAICIGYHYFESQRETRSAF